MIAGRPSTGRADPGKLVPWDSFALPVVDQQSSNAVASVLAATIGRISETDIQVTSGKPVAAQEIYFRDEERFFSLFLQPKHMY